MKNLIIILLIFSIGTINAQKIQYSSSATCPFQLGEIVEIKLPEKGFNNPKLSPDGTKMLLSKGYKGIYEIDLNDKKTIKTVSEREMDGFNMNWSGTGDEITFIRISRKSDNSLKSEYFKKDLSLKSASVHDITDFNSPISSLKNLNNKLIVLSDIKNRKLIANNGEKAWDITPKIGVCLDIVISPDRTKVVFTCAGSEYVYATDGSGMITKLNAGLGKNWSPDGKYILYFRDEDKGGDTIVESDLYICKADGTEFWKLTDTPEVLETSTHWSSESNKITYIDETNGNIYVADIHPQNAEK